MLRNVILYVVLGMGSAWATPNVVVSILPLHACVAEIMRGVAVPELLIPPTQSPHTVQLAPEMRQKLAQANLIVYASHNLEEFLRHNQSKINKKSQWMCMQDKAPVRYPIRFGGCGHETLDAADPHLWLSLRNMHTFADLITDQLSLLDPDHSKIYKQNNRQVQERLHKLEKILKERVKKAGLGAFKYLAFHDAYQYFDRQFITECIGVLTRDPHQPLLPHQIQEALVAMPQAQALFFEAQFPRLALKWPLPVASLNPYGEFGCKPGLACYEEMMYNLVTVMARFCK